MRNSKKKFFTTLFLLGFLAFLPISCDVLCNNSCGCGPVPETKNFSVISFSSSTVNSQGQEIPAEEFGFYNEVHKELKVQDFELVSFLDLPSSPSIPGIAFACDPLPPKSIDELVFIEIYNSKEVTLDDGTVLKVGEILNDFFTINTAYTTDPKNISDFFSQSWEIYFYEPFNLHFSKNPGKEIVITFSIRFLLENEKEISLNDVILSIK